jgi:alanyl aminopeptidase
VADAATGYIEAITGILDADQLPRVEPAMRAMVAPRFASLANKMDAGSQLLRQRLQRFLIVIAKDQSMRKPLAARAAKIIGLQGEADPSAAPASEYETILSVGVQDIGEPFFDLLLQRVVESDDPQFRNAAIGALARVEDPAVVKKLQNAVLAGTFKGTEALGVLFRQMVRKATTELTYAWLKENDRVIIAMIPETFRSNVVPTFGSAFCTNERADDWQAFIEAHADELPGYERDLAQTLESIHLCAALKKAGDTQLISAFEQVR